MEADKLAAMQATLRSIADAMERQGVNVTKALELVQLHQGRLDEHERRFEQFFTVMSCLVGSLVRSGVDGEALAGDLEVFATAVEKSHPTNAAMLRSLAQGARRPAT